MATGWCERQRRSRWRRQRAAAGGGAAACARIANYTLKVSHTADHDNDSRYICIVCYRITRVRAYARHPTGGKRTSSLGKSGRHDRWAGGLFSHFIHSFNSSGVAPVRKSSTLKCPLVNKIPACGDGWMASYQPVRYPIDFPMDLPLGHHLRYITGWNRQSPLRCDAGFFSPRRTTAQCVCWRTLQQT